MEKVCVFSLTVLVFCLPAWSQSSSELDFTSGITEFREMRRMLRNYLNSLADEKLQERQKIISSISTLEELRNRKELFRKQVLEYLGGLPERTPLNARVVGNIDHPAYRIEKIIFESQPRFYVTANLYVPKQGKGPYPAILYPLGHEDGGKANPTWQRMLGSLAKKGFVALTWDPIGQGERVQLYDQDLRGSKIGDSVTEHTVLGIQTLLVGDHLARYTIWDGMRALDYLLSRPEVDPTRVGITGNSGGGMHTAYIAALDDRLAVAAPSCYITSWRKMLETIGPQDGEQVFPRMLADGFDYSDYILAFAPKPYLILSAIRDFFPIGGARDTYAEVARVYRTFGAQDKLQMFEGDDGHGYTSQRRLKAYDWFGQWLKDEGDGSVEPEIEIVTEQELNCTSTGQVLISLGGETVASLNRKRLSQLRANRRGVPEDLPRLSREISGFAQVSGHLPVSAYGVIERQGYRIEKLVYESEPGILIPSLLYLPANVREKRPALLLVSGQGKAEADAEAEDFAAAGMVVLSIDARGFGESRPRANAINPDDAEFLRYFGDYDDSQIAFLLGKSLVGMRMLDIRRGIDLLAARREVDAARIYAYGGGAGSIPLLFAALSDNRIQKIALDRMLSSYAEIVASNIQQQILEGVVPGALRSFDLPDMVAALAPREVWLVDVCDALGYPALPPDVQGTYHKAVDAFEQAGAARALHVENRKPGQNLFHVMFGESRSR